MIFAAVFIPKGWRDGGRGENKGDLGFGFWRRDFGFLFLFFFLNGMNLHVFLIISPLLQQGPIFKFPLIRRV